MHPARYPRCSVSSGHTSHPLLPSWCQQSSTARQIGRICLVMAQRARPSDEAASGASKYMLASGGSKGAARRQCLGSSPAVSIAGIGVVIGRIAPIRIIGGIAPVRIIRRIAPVRRVGIIPTRPIEHVRRRDWYRRQASQRLIDGPK
jgi:hypothetical protein